MNTQGGPSFYEEQIVREENCASTFSRYASIAGNPQLAQMFSGFARVATEHTNTLRSFLRGQDVATDAVIQNRVLPSSTTGGSLPGSPPEAGFPGGNVPPVRGRDEDMVDDAFLSLKVLADSYRAALRQSGDESLTATLIGMRREIEGEREELARYLQGSR